MTQIVYFWIEKYNNIKETGFNFGSEYIFNYNLISNEITATKNKEFIPNFYDSSEKDTRISNISAIVGENASGKSSLLTAIRLALSIIEIGFNDRDKLIFASIFKKDNSYFIQSNIKRITLKLGNQTISKIKNTTTLFPVFYKSAYDFNLLYDDITIGSNLSSDYFLQNDNTQPDDIEQSQGNFFENHKIKELQRQIHFVQQYKGKDITEKITIPRSITITIKDSKSTNNERYEDYPKHDPNYATMENGSNESLYLKKTDIPDNYKKQLSLLLNNSMIDEHRFDLDINNQMKYKVIHSITLHLCKYYDQVFYKRNNNNWNNEEHLFSNIDISSKVKEITFSKIKEYTSKDQYNLSQLIEDFDNFIKELPSIKSVIVKNFRISLFKIIEEETTKKDFSNSTLTSNTDNKLFNSFFKNYIDYLLELQNKTKVFINKSFGFIDFSWRNMSSGELSYLNLFSRFNDLKNKFKTAAFHTFEQKDILILIDEGELGFHLQWQKEYINNLIHILPEIFKWNNVKPNIQIIFTTHSPVSLSDIPKTNVLFMSNGSILKESNKTFAANIHSIIKQSFFMHDGFIGKFAENKINSIIKEISNNKSIKKERKIDLEKVINIIDEPIIKTELQQLLHGKESEKERLRREIQAKEEQLKELEND